MLLAGDVGGTKTDLAIYWVEAGPHSPLAEAEFRSADYPSLLLYIFDGTDWDETTAPDVTAAYEATADCL
jgi:glucokinase